jgi:molybdate/tungstate transport system substrate-binding protein
MIRKMKIFRDLLALISLFLIASCNNSVNNNQIKKTDLIIFHAGSLSKPFHEIADAFHKENPGINVLLEAAGSRECARKISELKKPCDIIATSDYSVIETLLIPEYTDWLINFATNEMCIAFTAGSRFSQVINDHNWFEILLNNSVFYGRSVPDLDPCGYRTVIMFELTEKIYHITGLSTKLVQKDKKFIRPKEVDLLALLESHAIDYIVIYTSVAQQHNLDYITLPDQINLSNTEYRDFYSLASIELVGKTRNEKIIQKGEPMIYAISILKNSPNKETALQFMAFLLRPDYGLKILEDNGQKTIVSTEPYYEKNIPQQLKGFLK